MIEKTSSGTVLVLQFTIYCSSPLNLPYLISVIVDSGPGESSCHQAKFNIGGSTTTSRSWTIRITQYACGDYDKSGWPGCLQYYTATANNIQR